MCERHATEPMDERWADAPDWDEVRGSQGRKHNPNVRTRPDAGPPYTLEELNELTGSRVHRKATVYTTREDALSRMREKVRSMRPFAVVSVLDRAGNEVESARGEAGGSSQQKNPSSRHRAGEVLAGRADPGGGTPIANASEVDFFEDNRFVREGPLWQFQFGAYGTTNLYVWADSMDSGFEIAVEWLDDHAPGLLVMVGEEDYQQAANELGKVWDPSDPDDEIMQTAEADMTMIGHTTLTHGNAVPSWEWHAHEVERGSPEWNEVVERSREESGSADDDSDEYEENASKSQSVVLAALRGQASKAGAFATRGGIVYSYALPIADLRNPDGPYYVLSKSASPSVTTSKHIGFVLTWLKHIKAWAPVETVPVIQA